jgi:hypothetical protein
MKQITLTALVLSLMILAGMLLSSSSLQVPASAATVSAVNSKKCSVAYQRSANRKIQYLYSKSLTARSPIGKKRLLRKRDMIVNQFISRCGFKPNP